MPEFNLEQDKPTELLEHNELVEFISSIDAKQLANFLAIHQVVQLQVLNS